MDRRLGWWVGGGVALALLLLQLGEVTVSDGADMLAVSHALLHHFSLAVPAGYGVLGRNGHYFAKYGIGLSIAALPFVALGDLAAVVLGHQAQAESFGASSLMPLVMGLLAVTLWHIACKLGASARWAAVVAVGAVAGTYALPYGKDFFSEPLTALGIAIAIDRLLARRYAVAGLGLGLAVVTRPEAVVLVVLMPAVVWRFRDFQGAVRFGLVAAAGGLVDAGYNLLRFGSVLKSGYGREGFSTPFFHGAAGLLFGTNKSLFLFAPVVIVLLFSLRRMARSEGFYTALALTNFLAFFVLSALWDSWQGGWSWGPRLILPGVLCAMPLLARAGRIERRAAFALLLIGFVVSASTLLVPTEAQELDHPNPTNGPSIIRQYSLIPSVVRYSVLHLRAAHIPGASRRYLALWQVNLGRELGTKGLLMGLVGSVILLAALMIVVGRAWHLLQTAAPMWREPEPERPDQVPATA